MLHLVAAVDWPFNLANTFLPAWPGHVTAAPISNRQSAIGLRTCAAVGPRLLISICLSPAHSTPTFVIDIWRGSAANPGEEAKAE